MLKRYRLPAFFSLALALTVSAFAADRLPPTSKEMAQGYSDHSILAQPKAGSDLSTLEATEQREGRTPHSLAGAHTLRRLEPATGESVEDAISRLRATGRYEYVEPDYIVHAHATPNDTAFSTGDQWYLRNVGQSNGVAGADIHATDGWDIQSDAPNVLVGIIDSGIRTTHIDLTANLWRNPGEIAQNLRDDDGDGIIDDIYGFDATATSTLLRGNLTDDANHGTGVASIIGAVGNNQTGMTGIAWRTQIIGARFLDSDGSGYTSDEIDCFDFAIAKKVQVINCSFGGTVFSQSVLAALGRARAAGIIVVCSAGNDGQNNDLINHYPSNYLIDNVIAVANTTRRDDLSSSSDFGSGLVDLAAPGTSIYLASNTGNSSYTVNTGTSFSAPMVTGAVALLRAKYPSDTYRQTINRLLRGVDRLSALTGKVATGGRLNLAGALSGSDTRPVNDDFAQAIVLSGETITARSSSQGATAEIGEPTHAGVAGGSSLWWTWTAPRTGTVQLHTTDSAIDTTLAVYTGNSVNALTTVVSNDNDASAPTSRVSFAVTAGTTYRFAVDGKAGTTGLMVLHLSLLSANDSFASAQVVSGRSFRVSVDNRTATREAGEPLIRGVTGGHSVWFKWVAPVTRRYYVSAWDPAFAINPMIAVYTGTTLTGLTEVASSLDAIRDFDSPALNFTAVAGTTYYIALDSQDTVTGSINLSLIDSDWEELGAGPLTAPAVGKDGSVYAADYYGIVHALNPDGTLKWLGSEFTGYVSFGCVALGTDGTVYVGDDAGYLYALDGDTGARKWRFNTASVINGSPAVASDGTIYFRTDGSFLFALNPDGTRKWAVSLGAAGATYASPAIGSDGTIYCGSYSGRLYAITSAGAIKWSFDTGGIIYASPAIASDGTLYVGSASKKFLAINPDGTQKWVLTMDGTISQSAVIGLDGTVYFGCGDSKIYAVNSAGVIRWSYTTRDLLHGAAPVVASDGTIYACSLDGFVYVLSPDGTLNRVIGTNDELRNAPVLANGKLYLTSYDWRLYAVDVGQVAASTAWPMARQNLQRTARLIPQSLAIGVQPAGVIGAVGSVATFSVGAVGTGPLTYQWRFNGTAIAGATGPSYSVDPVGLTKAGQYSVVITDANGSITSNSVSLAITGGTTSNLSRLSNLSSRTQAGAGDASLITGFYVDGTGTQQFVIRAIGPTLGNVFGVDGSLSKPRLRLIRDGVEVATNTGWAGSTTLSQAFAQVGAFPLSTTSNDSALLVTLQPGSYSAVIDGVNGTTGVALVELYAVNKTGPRLINLSCRANVGTGADVLITGFYIDGTDPKQLLIRAAGPVLGGFGVQNSLTKPKLELYSGSTVLAENTGWSSAPNADAILSAGDSVAAFRFPAGSADCAMLVTLLPGSYSAKVSGLNNTTGVALVEVYEVP